MTPRQRRFFLAAHAGMWCWRSCDGVYVARSLHEGKQHFRFFSTFLIQHYQWDGRRYRRPQTLISRQLGTDLEADLLLSEVVGRPLEGLCARFKLPAPESGPLPPPLYTKQGKGLSWFFAREDGLYLVRMIRDKLWRNNLLQVSFRPYDRRHRWVTILSETFETIPEVEAYFAIAVEGIDELIMSLVL